MPTKKLKTGNPKVDEALGDIYKAIDAIESIEILKGRLVTVVFPTGELTQRIVHKLGRAWQGYIKVDATSGVTFHRDNLSQESPKVDFYLTSSAPATLILWVF